MRASPPTEGLSRVRSWDGGRGRAPPLRTSNGSAAVKWRGVVTPPYGRPIESPCVIRAGGCGHPPLRKVYRSAAVKRREGQSPSPTHGLSKHFRKTAGGAEPLPYALPIEGLRVFYSMTGRFSTTWAQRGHRSGCLALLPTVGSTFQQRPHLQPLAGRTATDCSVPTSTRT